MSDYGPVRPWKPCDGPHEFVETKCVFVETKCGYKCVRCLMFCPYEGHYSASDWSGKPIEPDDYPPPINEPSW